MRSDLGGEPIRAVGINAEHGPARETAQCAVAGGRLAGVAVDHVRDTVYMRRAEHADMCADECGAFTRGVAEVAEPLFEDGGFLAVGELASLGGCGIARW